MNETMVTAKTAIVAFITTLSAFLGWKGVMAVMWVALMFLDYTSGTFAARKEGKWKSSVAREGLWHKGGMVLVVLVAFISDFVMGLALPHIPVLNVAWPEILAPLVLAWYIITELGSILENAVKLGANVPHWIIKIFDATLKMVDSVGEEAIEELTGSAKKNE